MSFVGDAIAAYYAEQLVKAIAVVAVVAIVVGVCLFLTWRWQPSTLRSDIDRLEQRMEVLEAKEERR